MQTWQQVVRVTIHVVPVVILRRTTDPFDVIEGYELRYSSSQ